MNNDSTKIIIGAVLVVLVAFIAYGMMTAPDTRSTSEHIGDAIGKLDEGADDAARELEDRTPAQRIRDDVSDATDGSPE